MYMYMMQNNACMMLLQDLDVEHYKSYITHE